MHFIKKLFPQEFKNIYHLAQAVLANVVFGFPSKKIRVIGVTGTDGKTTTVQMIVKILEAAGKKVAMASTINFKIDQQEWTNLSHFTTLSAWKMQKFIAKAVAAKCEYVILETSSHSLDQYRVWGIDYRTAVITNATREHLDYHGTMEKYRQAKKKLFCNVAVAIVNLDMEKPDEYLNCDAEMKIGYSILKSEIRNSKSETNPKLQNPKFKTIIAEDINLGISGSTFVVGSEKFRLNLAGDFNIENALAAISVGRAEKIDLAVCAQALEKIMNVPGRMEEVPNKKGLNILVDFALTPAALEKLYCLLKKIKKPETRIIAVFGSCGERDRGKRPIMGEIVAQHADFIILTNDEPYHEDPMQIIREIAVGIKDKKENESFWIIPDRRQAIRKALQIAKSDDIIAVTGMGAEESMVVGDEKIPWNDKKVILEELEKI